MNVKIVAIMVVLELMITAYHKNYAFLQRCLWANLDITF